MKIDCLQMILTVAAILMFTVAAILIINVAVFLICLPFVVRP